MKKVSLITKLSSLIFIVLVVLAICTAKPLYNRLEKTIDYYSSQLFSFVTEKTGLYLSYESLSPSILTSFSVNGIKLKDSDSHVIIELEKTKVNYRLSELIKGNISNFVRSVSIDGVELEVQELIELIGRISAQMNIKKKPQSFDIESITSYIPSTVTLTNIIVNYEDENVDASVKIKDIQTGNVRRRRCIEVNTDCAASAYMKKKHLSMTGNARLNGTVFYGLENSFVNITLSDFTEGTVKLNKLNLLATYENKKIGAQLVKTSYPLSLNGLFDLSQNKVSAELKSEQLVPSDLFASVKNKNLLKILKNAKASLNGTFECNIPENKINYTSDGNLYIPDCVLPGGANADYKISGDDKKIEIQKLLLDGPDCNGDAELSLTFETMQAAGYIGLPRLQLPGGTEISTEVYIDPLAKKGFMAFIPQLFAGDKSLTALQLKLMPLTDSYDFEFEAYDYSHFEADNPGKIQMSGSYLLESNYVQTSVSLNSIYVQSVLDIVKQFLDEKTAATVSNISGVAEPFMFSGEAYLSTDFSSVSYNLPYLVLANTKADNQFVYLSVNGNENLIQVNQLNMIFGPFALNSSASFERSPDSDDMFFTFDAVSGAIPYHLVGTVMPQSITITGDYNTGIVVRYETDKKNRLNVTGSVLFENLPIGLGLTNLITTTDVSFSYNDTAGPEVQLARFEVEISDGSTSVSPRLILTGNGTKYGAQFSSISYTDLYSNLEGSADVTLNIIDSIFTSAGINGKVSDLLTGEEISIDANVSNPDMLAFSADALKKSLYISAFADFKHFSLNRFMNLKNSNNEVSASLSLSGTLEHPYAVVNVENFAFLFANNIVKANGAIILEDKELAINEFNITFPQFQVTDISANASIDKLQGELKATFQTVGPKNIVVPLKLSLLDTYIPDGQRLPENMLVNISTTGIGGTLMKEALPLDVNIFYSPEMLTFYSSDNLGLNGTYDFKTGLDATVHSAENFSCDMFGQMGSEGMNFVIDNIVANIPSILSFMNLEDVVKFERGIAKGTVLMSGTLDNPEFGGSLSIDYPDFEMPMFFNDRLTSKNVTLEARINEFVVEPTIFNIHNTPMFYCGTTISLNKWVLEQFLVTVESIKGKQVPVGIKLPVVSINGETICNFQLLFENNCWNFNGEARFDNTSVITSIQELAGSVSSSVEMPFGMIMNMNVIIGNHVRLTLNPLLRCVVVPNSPVAVNVDTQSGIYSLEGEVQLKSGDVTYLNRNFYIKEGSIKFNSSDIANPLITIKAETREQDSKGKNIKVILSTENQYLQNFEPKFSSVPPKSDAEIRAMLGQIVIGDTDSVSDIFVTAGDYYLQSTVVRNMENKLRDLLNFDIFSVRTNILQNTMSMSMTGAFSTENRISLGNFLDNSTVYIGKYLGSNLYVDAMLNMSLEDPKAMSIDNAGGVLLQPEIGFEFELPFFDNVHWKHIQDMDANIRMGLAWDLGFSTPNNKLNFSGQFIPSMDFNLSWRL